MWSLFFIIEDPSSNFFNNNKMVRLKEIMDVETVKTVLMAIGLHLLIGYYQFNKVPDLTSILYTVGIMVTITYLLRNNFNKPDIKNHFMSGAVAYISFVIITLFFKLTDVVPIFKEELVSALVFGGLTTLSFIVYERFIK